MSTTLRDPSLFFPIPTPGAVPNTANGLDVRVAAEFSADVRNMNLWFSYDANDESVTVSDRQPAVAQLPPVFTSDDAVRPVVDSVSISIPLFQPLSIPATAAGALFWSEASVEKFFLPYYASVYGWEAASLLLDQVSTAWFDYAADRAQVVALAYAWGSPADFVTPTRTLEGAGSVHVVYADMTAQGTPLRMVRLDEFLAIPGIIGRARGTDGQVQNPTGNVGSISFTGNGTLNTIGLRELAEFARGLKGQYLAFDTGPTGVTVNACATLAPCGWPGSFTCATGLRRPDRPAPDGVSVTVNLAGTPRTVPLIPITPPLPAPPDAIFWHGGSIEKLMLPYYASVMGRQAPFYLALLLAQWEGHMDVLPLTQHDDHALAIEALTAMADGTGPAETDVFAVVHLPRSEYVPEPVDDGTTANFVAGGGQTLNDRTRLLRLDADGFRADRVR